MATPTDDDKADDCISGDSYRCERGFTRVVWGGMKMKVMLVNGSPHAKGNTFTALDEMQKV